MTATDPGVDASGIDAEMAADEQAAEDFDRRLASAARVAAAGTAAD